MFSFPVSMLQVWWFLYLDFSNQNNSLKARTFLMGVQRKAVSSMGNAFWA